MKVIFSPTMFRDIHEDLKKGKEHRAVSGHKFQENLLLGLQQNGMDVFVVNVPRVKHYPVYPDAIIRSEPFVMNGKVCGISIGVLNLKWLNYLSAGFQVFHYARKRIKECGDEDIVCLTFNTYIPQTLCLLLLRKIYPSIMLCDVIGDLHGKYGVTVAGNDLHARAVRQLGRLLDKMAHEEDCFVFLSSEMAEAIDVLDKPYVVMEGFYQHKKGLPGERLKDSEKNLVFYAGYLGADYGIEHMLRAFSQINDNSYRLVMAGYGQNDEMIRRYLDRDDRIRFLGMITPEEVEMWQQKATVLISPRTSEQKFAKYSFPSKTMECLASGKPYIAHKLPCDPPEYAEYIQYVRDESDEALREKIMEICEMTEEQRLEVGERAKTFIINEKNPKVMCKRIIKMWEKMCDE